MNKPVPNKVEPGYLTRKDSFNNIGLDLEKRAIAELSKRQVYCTSFLKDVKDFLLACGCAKKKEKK